MSTRHIKVGLLTACFLGAILPLAASGLFTATSLDNDIPGVEPPVSPFSESADYVTDLDDVYRFDLTEGQWFYAASSGAAATDFDLYLFGPGTRSVGGTSAAVAHSENVGTSTERILYRAKVSGPHYLDVWAFKGTGAYSVTYGFPSKQPTMTVSAPRTVAWAGPASVIGTLTAEERAVEQVSVTLYHRPRGKASFTKLATTKSGSGGRFAFTVKPARRTAYRVTFHGDPERLAVSYPDFSISPYARLTRPVAPTRIAARSAFTATGYLTPRHVARGRSVSVACFKFSSAKGWVPVKTVWATNANYSNYTRYTVRMSLPSAGKWKLVAHTPIDAVHIATSSSPRYITVVPR